MKGEPTSEQTAFLNENPYAAEASRLLDEAIEKRSEHFIRRAETFATLALAFEQRSTRYALDEGLHNHAQRTGSG